MTDNPEADPVYKTWIKLLNKTERGGYGSLSAGERIFWCVYELDLEAYRGGFLAYFGNTEGIHADEVVPSLTAIGAHETAAHIERLLRLAFPDGIPADLGTRRELALRVETDYDKLRDDINTLEDWYCQDPESIFDKLQSHARKLGFLVD